MKRGIWLAIAIFLMSIPSVLAQDTLDWFLIGGTDADLYLVRILYAALVFMAFFFLAKRQMFKKDEEKKYATIFSLAISFIVMRFTPDVALDTFKWIIMLIAPFILFYWISGFVIGRKEVGGVEKFSWIRFFIALILVIVIYILLAPTPGFQNPIGGIPYLGLAADEFIQDVNYALFYGMQPIWMIVIMAVFVILLFLLGKWLLRKKGQGGESGFGNIPGWALLAILIILIALTLWYFAGGFGLGGLKQTVGVGFRWLLYILIGAAILFVLWHLLPFLWGKRGGIWNWLTGWVRGGRARPRRMRVTLNPSSGNFELGSTGNSLGVLVKRGRFGRRLNGEVTVTPNVGRVSLPGEAAQRTLTESTTHGELNFNYHARGSPSSVTFTVQVSSPGFYNFSNVFRGYSTGRGVILPSLNVNIPDEIRVNENIEIEFILDKSGNGVRDGVIEARVTREGVPGFTDLTPISNTNSDGRAIFRTRFADAGTYTIEAEATGASVVPPFTHVSSNPIEFEVVDWETMNVVVGAPPEVGINEEIAIGVDVADANGGVDADSIDILTPNHPSRSVSGADPPTQIGSGSGDAYTFRERARASGTHEYVVRVRERDHAPVERTVSVEVVSIDTNIEITNIQTDPRGNFVVEPQVDDYFNIRGRVVDDNGDPVVGMYIDLSGTNLPSSGSITPSDRTRSDGSFQFTNLSFDRVGSFVLSVEGRAFDGFNAPNPVGINVNVQELLQTVLVINPDRGSVDPTTPFPFDVSLRDMQGNDIDGTLSHTRGGPPLLDTEGNSLIGFTLTATTTFVFNRDRIAIRPNTYTYDVSCSSIEQGYALPENVTLTVVVDDSSEPPEDELTVNLTAPSDRYPAGQNVPFRWTVSGPSDQITGFHFVVATDASFRWRNVIFDIQTESNVFSYGYNDLNAPENMKLYALVSAYYGRDEEILSNIFEFTFIGEPEPPEPEPQPPGPQPPGPQPEPPEPEPQPPGPQPPGPQPGPSGQSGDVIAGGGGGGGGASASVSDSGNASVGDVSARTGDVIVNVGGRSEPEPEKDRIRGIFGFWTKLKNKSSLTYARGFSSIKGEITKRRDQVVEFNKLVRRKHRNRMSPGQIRELDNLMENLNNKYNEYSTLSAFGFDTLSIGDYFLQLNREFSKIVSKSGTITLEQFFHEYDRAAKIGYLRTQRGMTEAEATDLIRKVNRFLYSSGMAGGNMDLLRKNVVRVRGRFGRILVACDRVDRFLTRYHLY